MATGCRECVAPTTRYEFMRHNTTDNATTLPFFRGKKKALGATAPRANAAFSIAAAGRLKRDVLSKP
jgi:hypothetical protein